MSNKRIVDFLQNLVLLSLIASAVYLLTCFPMLDSTVTGRMQDFFTRSDDSQHQVGDIAEAIATVHFVVTDQYEYGRYVSLNAATNGEEFKRLAPLFREAIGSAAAGETVSRDVFQTDLKLPGIYMDFGTVLPMAVVSVWLGEEYAGSDEVRGMGLVTAQETAVLYLYCGDGSIMRCASALTSAAVREVTAVFDPNGGRFAFESGYETLSPYAVLVQETPAAADVQASLPAGYTAYNLLTALEFNAHTTSRYYESSGVEVVMQTPFTLRIGTDGTVNCSADGDVPSGLYKVACAGETPTAQEALQSACTIAQVLCEGTNAADLSLDTVEQTEQGWIITFYYHVNGIRIHLAADKAALRVVVSGDTVTSFDFYCRSYTALEQSTMLLPPSMAAAIASMHKDAELTLAYVDNGADVLSARWLAQ